MAENRPHGRNLHVLTSAATVIGRNGAEWSPPWHGVKAASYLLKMKKLPATYPWALPVIMAALLLSTGSAALLLDKPQPAQDAVLRDTHTLGAAVEKAAKAAKVPAGKTVTLAELQLASPTKK